MRKYWRNSGLAAIAIVIILWTLFPIYHLVVLSLSPQEDMLAGHIWPQNPTLRNFGIVFRQQHNFLAHFWRDIGNSLIVAVTVSILTLVIATLTAFATSRLRVKGSRLLMGLALGTYLIPAAFLAIPMYRAMSIYGLLNTRSALILAMTALASPYAIWILKQASDRLPRELDEAAVVDGASIWQVFRLIYLPLMRAPMVAIGIYALLLAWNEYLYAFLLNSDDAAQPLSVGLGLFLGADDSPWNLLMTSGLIYAIPPIVIYYTFRKNMVSGITAGAVKS
ncbi:carbohydrate ABC transporter permease [Pleomorphomonas koreensis]|uniref:carbohydrate ABC transporter permease n=1 Tax=Pleomorphomonas koreensis TaxID=257440 RepID=UPI0003F775A2|nr:carbohydrate ABC transporter permease [Pleomorphomonas koreensis]